jgi:hypothetical protein
MNREKVIKVGGFEFTFGGAPVVTLPDYLLRRTAAVIVADLDAGRPLNGRSIAARVIPSRRKARA